MLHKLAGRLQNTCLQQTIRRMSSPSFTVTYVSIRSRGTPANVRPRLISRTPPITLFPPPNPTKVPQLRRGGTGARHGRGRGQVRLPLGKGHA